MIVALVRRKTVGFIEELHLVLADGFELFFGEQTGKQEPSLEIEDVFLFIGHRDYRDAVSVSRREKRSGVRRHLLIEFIGAGAA